MYISFFISRDYRFRIVLVPQQLTSIECRYSDFPQHFLNLRPLPQGQGSLRPTLGSARVTGVVELQHVLSLQPDSIFVSACGMGVLISLLIKLLSHCGLCF
jgi:hypothetical protein